MASADSKASSSASSKANLNPDNLVRRRAKHAGSWYSANGDRLAKQLQGWLDDVKIDLPPVRAMVCPHAGYDYSGPTAAYAYKHITPQLLEQNKIKRIFIIGPSHHHFTRKCKLTQCQQYDTPVGNLRIDSQTVSDLHKTGLFEWMDKAVDEAEHSIEMQLPYLAYLTKGTDIGIVPIMVGNVDERSEQKYGQILAPYLDQAENLFVISSDFCHWGDRFSFTYYDQSKGAIWQSIEHLDKVGVALLEQQDLKGWYEYLAKYENTICGRHPISVFLQAAKLCKSKFSVRMVQYRQSSKVQSDEDSSVSYVAAIASVK